MNDSKLKGLLSDIINLEKVVAANKYRLTIKRFNRLPEASYRLTIGEDEWILRVAILHYSEIIGGESEKVGILTRKGRYDSFNFSGYCEGSGRTIEVRKYEIGFGTMKGVFHINDTNLIGQIIDKN